MAAINAIGVVTNDYTRAESPDELFTRATVSTTIAIYDPRAKVGCVGNFADPIQSKYRVRQAEYLARPYDLPGFESNGKSFSEMMEAVGLEFPDSSRLEVTIAGSEIEPSFMCVRVEDYLSEKSRLITEREQRVNFLLDYFSRNGFDMSMVNNRVDENDRYIEMHLDTSTGEVTISPAKEWDLKPRRFFKTPQ